MVTNNCITTEQMNSVLNEPTPEYQNYALFTTLEHKELLSVEQVVKCLEHSTENAALLWMLKHEGGNSYIVVITFKCIRLQSTVIYLCMWV